MTLFFVLLMLLSINNNMDAISVREELNHQEESMTSDSSRYMDRTAFALLINHRMSNRNGFVVMSDSISKYIDNNPEKFKDGGGKNVLDYYIIISNQDYKKLLDLLTNTVFSPCKYEEAKRVLHIVINKYPDKYLIKDIDLNKDLEKVVDIFHQVIKDEKEMEIIIDVLNSKSTW